MANISAQQELSIPCAFSVQQNCFSLVRCAEVLFLIFVYILSAWFPVWQFALHSWTVVFRASIVLLYASMVALCSCRVALRAAMTALISSMTEAWCCTVVLTASIDDHCWLVYAKYCEMRTGDFWWYSKGTYRVGSTVGMWEPFCEEYFTMKQWSFVGFFFLEWVTKKLVTFQFALVWCDCPWPKLRQEKVEIFWACWRFFLQSCMTCASSIVLMKLINAFVKRKSASVIWKQMLVEFSYRSSSKMTEEQVFFQMIYEQYLSNRSPDHTCISSQLFLLWISTHPEPPHSAHGTGSSSSSPLCRQHISNSDSGLLTNWREPQWMSQWPKSNKQSLELSSCKKKAWNVKYFWVFLQHAQISMRIFFFCQLSKSTYLKSMFLKSSWWFGQNIVELKAEILVTLYANTRQCAESKAVPVEISGEEGPLSHEQVNGLCSTSESKIPNNWTVQMEWPTKGTKESVPTKWMTMAWRAIREEPPTMGQR